MMPARCGTCDEPLVRRPKESSWTFARRRFCSYSCSSRAKKPSKPTTKKFEVVMSQEEVAQALGVSRETVRRAELSAMAKLRPLWEDWLASE